MTQPSLTPSQEQLLKESFELAQQAEQNLRQMNELALLMSQLLKEGLRQNRLEDGKQHLVD